MHISSLWIVCWGDRFTQWALCSMNSQTNCTFHSWNSFELKVSGLFISKSIIIINEKKTKTEIEKQSSIHVTDISDRACACLKSVLRLGVDKDHRSLNWKLILNQTCTTTELNCRQELKGNYSISFSKLIQQWNVVALKRRVLFNIKCLQLDNYII